MNENENAAENYQIKQAGQYSGFFKDERQGENARADDCPGQKTGRQNNFFIHKNYQRAIRTIGIVALKFLIVFGWVRGEFPENFIFNKPENDENCHCQKSGKNSQ